MIIILGSHDRAVQMVRPSGSCLSAQPAIPVQKVLRLVTCRYLSWRVVPPLAHRVVPAFGPRRSE